MCAFTKCCCCIELRTGAITIAILDLMIGIPYFAIAIWGTIAPIAPDLYTSGTPIGSVFITIAVFNYLYSVVALGMGLCLLFGSIFYNKIATLVYLVFKMIGIVVAAIGMIVGIAGAILVGVILSSNDTNTIIHPSYGLLTSFICLIVLAFISIILQIYFWICVYGFYTRELKIREIVSHT